MDDAGTLAVKPWMIAIERWTSPPLPLTACRARAPAPGSSRMITATDLPPAWAIAELAAGVTSIAAITKLAIAPATTLVQPPFAVLIPEIGKVSSDLGHACDIYVLSVELP
jgi:hypothetical protein